MVAPCLHEMADLYPERVRLQPNSRKGVGSQLEHLRNMQYCYPVDLPTTEQGVTTSQLRMLSAVRMPANTTLPESSDNGVPAAGLIEYAGNASFEDTTGSKVRELECKLLESFDDYRTNCARVLRDIGAKGNAEECLQWAVDNTNVFVIRVESTGEMKHWSRM